MKRYSMILLSFGIGFYGSALFIDKDCNTLKIKSVILLAIVLVVLILTFIDWAKEEE